MTAKNLETEVKRLLQSDLSNRSYSDIKEELQSLGYDQSEMRYILQNIDDKGLIPLAKATNKSPYIRNIVMGVVLCLISLLTVTSLYFDKGASKEVYYVALAIFAVGYWILRSGLKQKQQAKEPDEL